MKLPIFETSRLILKEVTMADVPAYEKYFVNYEVIRNLAAAVPWPYPKNGVESFLQATLKKQGDDRWLWGIFLKTNPTELIGAVDLYRDGKPENRGFWLGRPFWKKGIMTEAVTPVIDYAFSDLGFEKLIFANAIGNEGSHQVKVKTGARVIRTAPAKFVDPKFTEHEIWELTKEDWERFRQQERK